MIENVSLAELEKEAREAHDRAHALQEKLQHARDRAAFESRKPISALVKRAHDCLCAYNHTDGCGWGYEETTPYRGDPLTEEQLWAQPAHERWLRHFDDLLKGDSRNRMKPSVEQLSLILDHVEAMKKECPEVMFLMRHGLVP